MLASTSFLAAGLALSFFCKFLHLSVFVGRGFPIYFGLPYCQNDKYVGFVIFVCMTDLRFNSTLKMSDDSHL